MQIEIKIDDSCKEPKIIVVTDQMTEFKLGVRSKANLIH